ncbi:MAG: erythromycin biosynthesis sensory transduction protein eryC1 [Thermoleophilia bacterium]|nr:erythromycin biosynthesis sensory transduction protein eryC1 [Thermoleophilia bacterium]
MIPMSPAGLKEAAAAHREELLAAITRVVDSGWYVLGPEVEAFEAEFAAWIGPDQHAVGVATGTDALELALRAYDIGPGDEVIVPTNALPTPYGVAASGATVVFVDVREADYNIDPERAAEALTDRTRAIVAVHLYGHPADIPALRAITAGRDIVIVEDCAQAHGAAIDGTPVGALGDIAAWSFYPTKNLGALGDGGAVTTTSSDIAARVRSLRMYGETQRYNSVEVGTNSRLDELQAAVLRLKLPLLMHQVERRQAIAAAYDDGLRDLVRVPPVRTGYTHARHLYPVGLDGRDAALRELQERGIPAGVHYPRCAHQQPAFAPATSADTFPVAESLSHRLLSLPMHPHLTDAQVEAVIAAMAEVATGA